MAPPSLEMMAAVASGSAPLRPAPQSREGVRRLASALALAIPSAAALAAGQPYVSLLVALIASVLAWEWVHVCGAGRFGAAGALLVALTVMVVALAGAAQHGASLATIALGLPLLGFVAWATGRTGAAWIASGIAYVGAPALGFIWLYDLAEFGKPLVVWLIVVIGATDIGAYFVGRSIGGPKLAPTISPGKTWSGLAGGTALAGLAGLAAAAAMGFRDPLLAALVAAALAPLSQAGDLFESFVKRRFGVKDASGLLPGHGGLMDRVDGLIAAILVVSAACLVAGGEPFRWL
jgi:phosphatidate cytidylyltransferase